MSAVWWVRRGTVEEGPFTVDQLKQFASSGQLDGNVQVRLGKTTQWVEPQRIDWLQQSFESTSQEVTRESSTEVSSAPPVPDSPPDRVKTPWYVYAAIGIGALIVLVVALLILMEYQKNGGYSSGHPVASNEGVGNHAVEENGVSQTPVDDDKPAQNRADEEGEAGLPSVAAAPPEGNTTGSATKPVRGSGDSQADTQPSDLSEPTGLKFQFSAPLSGEPAKTDAEFFGISAEGNQFAYVVDVSSSMAGAKFEKARQELLESIDRLEDHQEFFIVFFNNASHPQPKDGLIRATDKNKALVKKWVMQQVPTGGTDPLESILRAMEKGPEAIFVLSDGEFDFSVVTTVGTLNTQFSVPIHTIGFMEDAHTLKQLANENRGTYRHVP